MQFISKFLLKFSFVRFIRSFIRSKITPFLRYFYYPSIVLLIVLIPYIVSKYRIEVIYLKNKLTNRYIEFIGDGNGFYSKVAIVGNQYTNYDDISKIVRSEVKEFSLSEENYADHLIIDIKDQIKKLPWVKNVVISRNLPSNLIVKIEEHQPFAIWEDKKIKYIIDKNGDKIVPLDDIEEFSNLLILSGRNANLNAKSLFDILVSDLQISKNVYSATWVGIRRWDIRFNDNLLVKLPDSNINKAWDKLVKIYNMEGGSLIDLKVIDLRVDDKVYLEYNDDSIRFLKEM